jgi:hypothetical protein
MNYDTSAETHGFAELARQLAFDFPEAMLPCPLCADNLHAEQLDRHMTKVYLLPPDKTIDQRSESFTLTGADRNIRATAIAFPFVFIPTMVLLGRTCKSASSRSLERDQNPVPVGATDRPARDRGKCRLAAFAARSSDTGQCW